MIDGKGVATATAVAVIAVLGIGGTVGVPTYVDSNADQMPDDTFYGLEIAGEHIKEAAINAGLYGNKADWQHARWKERMNEFENMAIENKASKYMGVLRNAQDRMEKACRCAENLRGLSRAEVMCRKHIQVLRRVKEKAPENARRGLEIAIRNAQKCRKALENAENAVRRRRRRRRRPNVQEVVENKMSEARKKFGKIPSPRHRRRRKGE